MASRPPMSDSSAVIPPSVDPEVALLLTNEETLCEKAITLLLKISSSIVQQPNEKRVRSLNLASRAMELTLLPAHGAFELLFFMGFQEANDRLVMPDDACLETVKMYQQQLHQLLNWKTSSSSGGSTMPAVDTALLSPASLHSPASVRSSTLKSTPRGSSKESQASGKKRLSTGGSSVSKIDRSPSRVTASSVASSKKISGSLHSRGETSASATNKKEASKKKDAQTTPSPRQQSSGNTCTAINVPKPSLNSNKSRGETEGSSAVIKNGNVKNPDTSPIKLPPESSCSSSSRPPLPQTSASCVKTLSRATPSVPQQLKSTQASLSAPKTPSQQTVNKSEAVKPSDTASRSSSSSHASVSTGGSSSSGSSSMASSVMTPVSSVSTTSGSTVTAAATGATSKKLSPYKLRPHQRWLSRFRGYLERVLTYENHVHQAKARSVMPMARLHSAASAALKADALARKDESKADAKTKDASDRLAKPFDFNDYLLLELTSWFKRDFFRWFDCGWCSACRCNMASKSTVPPTKYELEGEANTVEYYQCQTCGADRRFPRYLNVGRLLETKEGRCGEWASCFTLCCRTLGFDARQVFDETDHTWTEVWSHSQSRWVHVDPCEGRVDCPLLYECGWGKALNYITAASRDEVIDVTWRYTLQPNEVKKRRDKVSEEELCQHLWSLTVQLQQQHQQHTRHQLHLRMAREMASFFSPARTPTKAELEGRSSGSLGWRVSRGETGVLQTTSHHTFTLHHTARITTLTVKYNPVRDSYLCEGTVGPAMLQGWQSGVHTAANLAIKRELDWHNVYIARTEGETAARVGEVTWRVRWESSRVRLDALHVVLRHTTFHGAAVTWGVTFDGEHHPGDESGELRLENLCSRAANKAAVNPKSSSVRSTSSIHTSRDSTKTNNNTSATGNSALSDNAAKCSLDSKLRKTSPLQITKRSGDNAGVSQRRSSASPNSRITTQRGKGADAGKSKTDVRPTSCNVKLTKGRDVRDSTPIDNIKSTAINNNTKDSRSASASRGAFNGTTENMSVSNRSSSIDGRSKSVTSSQMLDNSACALDNSPRDGHTSGELVVRAVLSGGEGDNAWQHAQLFRMPDDDVDSAPFIIELNFQ